MQGGRVGEGFWLVTDAGALLEGKSLWILLFRLGSDFGLVQDIFGKGTEELKLL